MEILDNLKPLEGKNLMHWLPDDWKRRMSELSLIKREWSGKK